MKKRFSAEQKTAVVLDAFTGSRTIAEISSTHGVHATQVSEWKSQAKQLLKDGFSLKRKKDGIETEATIARLYQLIGKRDAELEWFKKKLSPYTP